MNIEEGKIDAQPETTARTSEPGANLDLTSLRAQEPKNPGRILRRALTLNASEEGLSYRSCQALREILDQGFSLNGTRGVWDNVTTARNMIFVALDSIPNFRAPRTGYIRLIRYAADRDLSDKEVVALDNKRTVISALIYEHILRNGEGAGSEFIAKSKLSTLTSMPRAFLERTDSLGALIRFALPGVIDEQRAGCVRPHHIEHHHLNDPSYCERLFTRSLAKDMAAEIAVYKHTKVYGSGSKDYQQSIQVLAKAIQEKVLDYPGGGEAWLAYHGISSLISRQCLQLSSQSFGGLLDRFYPDVVSEKDPQLIQPHEVHNGLWDRKGYARLQILRAFLSYSPEIAGVSEFHELAIAGKPIPSELRKRAYENAKTISTRDFIAHGKLQSIHIRPPAFISPNPTFSLDEIARFCFQPQRRA